MKNAFLFFFLVSISILESEAQNFSKNYTPLRSVGDVPEELKLLSSENYEKRKEGFKDDKRKTRKTKEEFILQSTFAIDELLLSGDVFYNDTVGNYINTVADELLKNDLELRNKLKFYLVRSNYVNAFATERGAIFITVGLMAKLSNEAELAFILAHEIIHYKNNHLINGYIETENIKTQKGKYKNKSAKEILLSTSNYSKELELEADQEGFDLFAKSNYSLEASLTVMEVLKYSSYPFSDRAINFEFIHKNNYSFPEDYFTDSITEVTINEDYNDSLSTHPNIKKRKELIELFLDYATESSERKLFIKSEETFTYTQELCRFELINNYAAELDYAMGFYSNYVLQEKYPNNIFLRKNMAYLLYAMARYKSYNINNEVIRKERNWQGNFLKSIEFLNNVRNKEIAAIAVEYIYQLHKEIPEDEFIELILKDALRTLALQNEIKLDYFLNKKGKTDVLEAYALAKLKDPYEGVDTSEFTRIEHKRFKRQLIKDQRELEKSIHFDRFILSELITDSIFTTLYTNIEKEAIIQSDTEKRILQKKKNNRLRKERKFGKSLGVDKLIISEPYYKRYDTRKKIQNSYIESEKKQVTLREDILKISNKLELEITTLDQQELIENDIDRLNDYSVLNSWLSESSSHDMVRIIPYSSQYVNYLPKKYGTDYFAWIGVINTTNRSDFNWSIFTVSAYTLIGLPIYLGYLLSPDKYTLYYAIVADLKEGTFKIQDFEYSNNNDSKDLIRGQLYQSLLQVKRKKDYTK